MSNKALILAKVLQLTQRAQSASMAIVTLREVEAILPEVKALADEGMMDRKLWEAFDAKYRFLQFACTPTDVPPDNTHLMKVSGAKGRHHNGNLVDPIERRQRNQAARERRNAK